MIKFLWFKKKPINLNERESTSGEAAGDVGVLKGRRKSSERRDGQKKVEGRESAALGFLIKSGQWSE